MAASKVYSEPLEFVTVYFNNKLMAATRIQKRDASGLDAFVSPDFPVLGYFDGTWNMCGGGRGGSIDVILESRRSREKWQRDHWVPEEGKEFDVVKYRNRKPLSVATTGRVVLVQLFPGITQEFLNNVLRPPVTAAVLQAFGTGSKCLLGSA